VADWKISFLDACGEDTHMPFEKNVILDRLDKLSRSDAARRRFGATDHDYKLNPPLSASVLEAFEGAHGIILPEDYRYFITEIGNGGAGPYYGLFPFGQHGDSFDFISWEEGYLVGDVSKPFPHVRAWNLPTTFWAQIPNSDDDKLWEAWDKIEYEHYWNPSLMNGAIPICNLGCNLRQWLVVNGEHRGFVWNDYRVDRAGISPLETKSGSPVSFADWYMSWLNE
jgi:hypothetical protein